MLGVLRAGSDRGTVAASSRRDDKRTRCRARAIVTASRIGDFDAYVMAMQVAADALCIRHV